MTRRPLPAGGGSYARDDKGKLKLTAQTTPASAARAPQKPAAKTAKADQKEASE